MYFERILVECISGHPFIEQPTSFILKGRQYEIDKIVDRWHEGGDRPGRPQMKYFKVRTADGDEYILRYNSLFNAWAVLVVE